jgi:RNA polymerase sigma factor (sigma-70 family)
MATPALGTLVQHIHGLASGCGDVPRSDRQLLDDFTARRDEAAFATLVACHGPMVLRVCRRVLNHEQDAEDAFQATFLVLARNTASIRKRDGVGAWLHGVAYRTAMKARRTAARRRRHEAQLQADRTLRSDEDSQRTASPSWDDVQAILDEEIQRLPSRYLEAFVLCVLEGKSGAAAAAELQCKEGTVKSRLSRARQMLQRQLDRRGINLAIVLAAQSVARDSSQAALPAALAQTAIRLGFLVAAGSPAAGVIPPHVAALAAGVSRAMFLSKTKITIIILLLAGVATAAGFLFASASAGTLAPVNARPQGTKETGAIDVRGQVLRPDGQPCPGARLFLPQTVKDQTEPEWVEQGVTDTDGRFHLHTQSHETASNSPMPLLAIASGFGLDWAELASDSHNAELTLRLVKDQPIRGRLLTTEGKAVPGVTIRITGVLAVQKLDDFLRLYQRQPRHIDETPGMRPLRVPVTEVLPPVQTDKDGRFEIRGVGAERVIALEMKHPALARELVLVATREGSDVQAIAKGSSGINHEGRLFGPTFDHVVEPARVILGAVREAATGKPIAGAAVNVLGVKAVSDAQGHYRVAGMRKAPQYMLEVIAPAEMSLVGCWMPLPIPSGFEPIQADVELINGVAVTGRVYDKATGKGVECVVHFAPLPENKQALKVRDLAYSAFTDREGRFRLVTIPGPTVLTAGVVGTFLKIDGLPIYPYKLAEFTAEDCKLVKQTNSELGRGFLVAGGVSLLDHCNACKVLDLQEASQGVSIDLALDPGKTLTVQVQDPDGRPLVGALAAGVSAQTLRALLLKTASCPVYALDPQRPRQMVFLHTTRKLAGVLTVRGDEKEPATVRLTPTAVVTGCVLDTDGQPVAGAEVWTLHTSPAGNQLSRSLSEWGRQPRTDQDGRFRLDDIVPGLTWRCGCLKGRQVLEPLTKRDIQVPDAGKPLDLGDIRVRLRGK